MYQDKTVIVRKKKHSFISHEVNITVKNFEDVTAQIKIMGYKITENGE